MDQFEGLSMKISRDMSLLDSHNYRSCSSTPSIALSLSCSAFPTRSVSLTPSALTHTRPFLPIATSKASFLAISSSTTKPPSFIFFFASNLLDMPKLRPKTIPPFNSPIPSDLPVEGFTHTSSGSMNLEAEMTRA